jgi:catechol 2,3-dioxygenase-like lactoylglutathione lyase family enzyme
MEVLSSRILLHPTDFGQSVRWYRDILGLRIYREYGTGGETSGVVFFLGGGFLELVGGSAPERSRRASLWLQVPDVDVEHQRLAQHGVEIVRPPRTEPWGLRECWIEAPDDVQIVLVEVPPEHPLRRRVD